MSDGGFFLMHRGWRDDRIFRGEYSRADAWIWLIENAAWKPSRTRIKGVTVDLARGELSFAQRFLAEKWGWSKSRVDRFIAELRDECMIETRSKNGATADHAAGQGQCIITICNYRKYQDKGERGRGNDDEAIGATSGQQRGKEEQGNKGTSEKEANASSSPMRAKGWPAIPEWMPVEPWNGFMEMRKAKHAWPTSRAVRLLIAKLDQLRAKGHDPGMILDKSTENNWTGLFEPKELANGRSYGATPIFGTAASGSRPRPGPTDGLAKAIHRRIAEAQSRGAPGEAGRPDAGYHEGTGEPPLAAARVLR